MEKWKLSDRLAQFVEKLFKENGPDHHSTEFYPSIIWSLGGEMQNGGKVREVLPPRYELGWIKRSDLGNFIAIACEAFGFVAFQPSKADEAASRRIIDIEDHNIFVR